MRTKFGTRFTLNTLLTIGAAGIITIGCLSEEEAALDLDLGTTEEALSVTRLEAETQSWATSSGDSVDSTSSTTRLYANAAGDFFKFSASVPAGDYTVVVRFAKRNLYGNYRLDVNGASVGNLAGSSSSTSDSWSTATFGPVSLSGSSEFNLVATSAGAQDFDLKLDYIELQPSGSGTTTSTTASSSSTTTTTTTTTTSGAGGAGGSGGSGGSGGTGGTGGTGGAGGGSASFGLFGYGSGATGGKGGPVVSVSTLAALKAEALKSGAAIIKVSGSFSGPDFVQVASDKTIVGVGAGAELNGIELNLKGSSNVIVRNLKIHHVLASNKDGDAIHLDGTHNIWIDHVELFAESPATQPDKDKFDGLIDITHDSSDVTISWSYLHDHWKGMLIGSSDSDASDRRVTFHHNYLRNINSRLPSYRGGKGHVYNSYFQDVETSGVNSRVGACLRVERNHFLNVQNPITTLDSAAGGTDRIDNLFEQTTGTQASGSNCTWSAPYSYPLDPVSSVKSLVIQNAGVGKTDPLQNLP